MDHSEFLELYDEGLMEEHRIEEYLLKNVLDTHQKAFLHPRDLTIVAVLNCRYTAADESDVFAWMRSVNDRLGAKLFSLV